MVWPAVPVPLMAGVLSEVLLSLLLLPVSLRAATSAAGAAGATVSSVKPPGVAVPATLLWLRVVLVVQAPLLALDSSLLGISWLMRPARMSAPVSVVVKVSVPPPGLVTVVVTTSPATAPTGKRETTGVPPALAASAAFTPRGASGRLTAIRPVSMTSSLVLMSVPTLPAASVMTAVTLWVPLAKVSGPVTGVAVARFKVQVPWASGTTA